MRPGARVLAVVGMVREAQIIAGEGVSAVIGAGNSAELEEWLELALERLPVLGLISFGVCGALDARLKPGDLLIGASVVSGDQRWIADTDWTIRLAQALPFAILVKITAGDVMVGSVAAKRALYEQTGAVAVDMESHIVARTAQRHALPFAVVRAVSDAADHALPPAALAGLGPDGRPNIAAVLRSLVAQPGQLPALLRTARDAEAAFRTLDRLSLAPVRPPDQP